MSRLIFLLVVLSTAPAVAQPRAVANATPLEPPTLELSVAATAGLMPNLGLGLSSLYPAPMYGFTGELGVKLRGPYSLRARVSNLRHAYLDIGDDNSATLGVGFTAQRGANRVVLSAGIGLRHSKLRADGVDGEAWGFTPVSVGFWLSRKLFPGVHGALYYSAELAIYRDPEWRDGRPEPGTLQPPLVGVPVQIGLALSFAL